MYERAICAASKREQINDAKAGHGDKKGHGNDGKFSHHVLPSGNRVCVANKRHDISAENTRADYGDTFPISSTSVSKRILMGWLPRFRHY